MAIHFNYSNAAKSSLLAGKCFWMFADRTMVNNLVVGYIFNSVHALQISVSFHVARSVPSWSFWFLVSWILLTYLNLRRLLSVYCHWLINDLHFCWKLEDKEETALLRQKIIELRRDWHRKNEEEIAKRWNYEEGVSSISLKFCTRWNFSFEFVT